MAYLGKGLKAAVGMLSALTIASLGGGAGLLNGVFTNVASDYVLPLTGHIRDALLQRHPNDMNHDLQRALAAAIKRSLRNIIILYKEHYPDREVNSRGVEFTAHLITEVDTLLDHRSGVVISDEEFKGYIYANDSVSSYETILARLQSSYIRENFDETFADFFKKNLINQIRFCFAEVLKETDFSGAKVAYRSIVQDEIRSGINELIAGQKRIEASLNELNLNGTNHAAKRLSAKGLKQLTLVLTRISSSRVFNEEFEQSIDRSIREFEAIFIEVRGGLQSIKTEVSNIRRISTKYGLLMSAILLIGLVVFEIFIVVNSPKTFSPVFALQQNPSLKVSAQYPKVKFPVKIIFFLPGKEVEVIVGKEEQDVYLPNISSKLRNTRVPIKLESEFWQTVEDSVNIVDRLGSIFMQPNNKLSLIEGTVSYVYGKAGNIFLKNATVLVGADTVLYTDASGIFKAELPIHMLKDKYEITVYAPGFQAVTEYYYPNSTPIHFMINPVRQ